MLLSTKESEERVLWSDVFLVRCKNYYLWSAVCFSGSLKLWKVVKAGSWSLMRPLLLRKTLRISKGNLSSDEINRFVTIDLIGSMNPSVLCHQIAWRCMKFGWRWVRFLSLSFCDMPLAMLSNQLILILLYVFVSNLLRVDLTLAVIWDFIGATISFLERLDFALSSWARSRLWLCCPPVFALSPMHGKAFFVWIHEVL